MQQQTMDPSSPLSSLTSETGDALVLSRKHVTPDMLLSLHDRLIGTQPEMAAQLSVLEMAGCDLDETCAEPLARLVNRLRGLRILNLSANKLGTRGVAALMERLTAPLKILLLSQNEVEDGAGRQVVSYLCYSRCELETLDLSYNHLSDNFAFLLARHLSRVSVHTIGLQFNDVTTEGARSLSQALESTETRVHSIDLRMNFIDTAALNPSALPPSAISFVPKTKEDKNISNKISKSDIGSDTDTVDSMDYTRTDLQKRMVSRLKSIEAQQSEGHSTRPKNITFTQRILSLREVTRQLRATQLSNRVSDPVPVPKDPPKLSATELIEELRRKTGIGTAQ